PWLAVVARRRPADRDAPPLLVGPDARGRGRTHGLAGRDGEVAAPSRPGAAAGAAGRAGPAGDAAMTADELERELPDRLHAVPRRAAPVELRRALAAMPAPDLSRAPRRRGWILLAVAALAVVGVAGAALLAGTGPAPQLAEVHPGLTPSATPTATPTMAPWLI